MVYGQNVNGGATDGPSSNGQELPFRRLNCYTCSTFDDPVHCKSMLNLSAIGKLSTINDRNNYSNGRKVATNPFKNEAISSITIDVDSIYSDVNGSLINGERPNTSRDKLFNPSSTESTVNSHSTAITDSPVPVSRVPFKECSREEKYCSVTRIEYVASEVKKKNFWAVERGCSSNCRQGCIILGEGKFRFN